MVTVLLLFCVMYMLSWWSKNRLRTAWMLTMAAFVVLGILFGEKDLVGIAVTLLLLPLLGKVRWVKPSEDFARDDSKPIQILSENPSVNPMHDDLWPW